MRNQFELIVLKKYLSDEQLEAIDKEVAELKRKHLSETASKHYYKNKNLTLERVKCDICNYTYCRSKKLRHEKTKRHLRHVNNPA